MAVPKGDAMSMQQDQVGGHVVLVVAVPVVGFEEVICHESSPQ
ncbi:MAG: hypothetical protein ACOYYU_19265 [Chloroflexota bacterium]